MASPEPALADRTYRVAHTYTDKANIAGNEFSSWLAVDGKMIGMVGGIRPRKFIEPIGTKLPAYVILVTTHISADYANPCDDVIAATRPSYRVGNSSSGAGIRG